MEKNQKKINSPFGCFRDFSSLAEKDFDQYYENVTVKQVVQKTGEGEDDYILVNKEIIDKVSIHDSIQAQAGDAGIDQYLEHYAVTGEKLPSVKVTNEINDYTEAPETLADAIALGEGARKKFASLDPKLTKGMKYDEFLAGITQKVFDEYIASLAPKKEIKEGDK